MSQAKSFTALMSNTFNKDASGKTIKPISEFAKELNALTPKDKREFAQLFANAERAPVELKLRGENGAEITEVFQPAVAAAA